MAERSRSTARNAGGGDSKALVFQAFPPLVLDASMGANPKMITGGLQSAAVGLRSGHSGRRKIHRRKRKIQISVPAGVCISVLCRGIVYQVALSPVPSHVPPDCLSWLEHWIVVPEAGGSSPLSHPVGPPGAKKGNIEIPQRAVPLEP